MARSAHLELVQPEELLLPCLECGSVVDAAALVQKFRDTIDGLQRDIRGWAWRYAELERDKDAEARGHQLWGLGREHFNVWRSLCNHPRSEWTAERFALALPYLKSKTYEPLIDRAIAGIAYDPFVTKRKNGTRQRHDGWHLLFKGTDQFESYVNRAPLEAG